MLKHSHIEEAPTFAAKPNGRSYLLLLAGACAWIALVSPMAFAQTSAAPGTSSSPTLTTNATPVPAFDVATIKPHAPGARTPFIGITNTADGVSAFQSSLTTLIQYAYGLKTGNQVSGVPEWAKDAQFDLQAKMSAADITEIQSMSYAEGTARREPMMQALLAERFKLRVHSDTKQVPIYELVVVKGGSKLRDAATETNPSLEKGKDGKPLTGVLLQRRDTSLAQGYSMASLADFLSAPYAGVGRPVVDKTGLSGTYDFTLHWSVYTAQVKVQDGVAVGSLAGDDAPSIFGALGEVGLKLQPATGPIEIVVIDHIEKPSEN